MLCRAVCVGQPNAFLLNGYFPRSCASMPVGGTCTAKCTRGYGGTAPVTVKCVADPSSPAGARWEKEASGTCDKGELLLLSLVGDFGCGWLRV